MRRWPKTRSDQLSTALDEARTGSRLAQHRTDSALLRPAMMTGVFRQ
jgi:hypothetical protein